MRPDLVFWSAALAAVGCGGSTVVQGMQCGRGTHAEDGVCVADATPPPNGAPNAPSNGPPSPLPPSSLPPASSDAGPPPTACPDGIDRFVIDGDDYIHSGPALTISGGAGWALDGADYDDQGRPTTLRFQMGNNWSAEFSTQSLGKPIALGTYKDAQRYPFQDPNHPGMDVSGDGRGCNTLSGEFTVTELKTRTTDAGDIEIASATVSFRQFCESAIANNFGCVHVEK